MAKMNDHLQCSQWKNRYSSLLSQIKETSVEIPSFVQKLKILIICVKHITHENRKGTRESRRLPLQRLLFSLREFNLDAVE